MSEAISFDGPLVTVPFAVGELQATVTDQYQHLLDSYDAEDILIIAGSPTSMGTFREILDDEIPGAAVPRVTSLIVQAPMW